MKKSDYQGQMYYFVYSDAPDCPSILYAIFDSLEDAREYHLTRHKNSGYVTIRQAWWEGLGVLPAYHETKGVK